jgi:hypothetical protein
MNSGPAQQRPQRARKAAAIPYAQAIEALQSVALSPQESAQISESLTRYTPSQQIDVARTCLYSERCPEKHALVARHVDLFVLKATSLKTKASARLLGRLAGSDVLTPDQAMSALECSAKDLGELKRRELLEQFGYGVGDAGASARIKMLTYLFQNPQQLHQRLRTFNTILHPLNRDEERAPFFDRIRQLALTQEARSSAVFCLIENGYPDIPEWKAQFQRLVREWGAACYPNYEQAGSYFAADTGEPGYSLDKFTSQLRNCLWEIAPDFVDRFVNRALERYVMDPQLLPSASSAFTSIHSATQLYVTHERLRKADPEAQQKLRLDYGIRLFHRYGSKFLLDLLRGTFAPGSSGLVVATSVLDYNGAFEGEWRFSDQFCDPARRLKIPVRALEFDSFGEFLIRLTSLIEKHGAPQVLVLRSHGNEWGQGAFGIHTENCLRGPALQVRYAAAIEAIAHRLRRAETALVLEMCYGDIQGGIADTLRTLFRIPVYASKGASSLQTLGLKRRGDQIEVNPRYYADKL